MTAGYAHAHGAIYRQGEYGYVLSSTQDNAFNMFYLGIYIEDVAPAIAAHKYAGRGVRCLKTP